MNRRSFCRSLGLTVATLSVGALPADAAETLREHLARVVGLQGAEVVWLDDLSAAQQRDLLSGLTSPGVPSRNAIDLLYRVIGRRERLFQYVGYPPLPNRLTACDGLIRE